MNEKETEETIKLEVERNNFVRAANMASTLGLEEDRLKDIRVKALWKMAAMNRNAPGTRVLADHYGFSKEETEHILKNCLNTEKDRKALKSRYDPISGNYITFKEWMELFLKNWNRLSVKSEFNTESSETV